MELPLIVVEHHALRQRGMLAYFAWLGMPAVLWLGHGRPPPGRAAVVCVAEGPPRHGGPLDSRGLRAVTLLRHAYPSLPIVGYSILPAERLPGLRKHLAAKGISLIAPLEHLDELSAALHQTIATAR